VRRRERGDQGICGCGGLGRSGVSRDRGASNRAEPAPSPAHRSQCTVTCAVSAVSRSRLTPLLHGADPLHRDRRPLCPASAAPV